MYSRLSDGITDSRSDKKNRLGLGSSKHAALSQMWML